MIALSTYKLANYLVDSVTFSTPYTDIAWKDVYELQFFQAKTSRNNCYVCTQTSGVNNYFFKQTKSFSEKNLIDLRSEAEFYQFARHTGEKGLGPYVPPFIFYDDYNGIIVTKYFPGFQQLSDCNTIAYTRAGQTLKIFHLGCKTPIVKKHFFADLQGTKLKKIWRTKPWIEDFGTYEPFLIKMNRSERQQLVNENNPYIDQLLAFLDSQPERVRYWRKSWAGGIRGLIHGDANDRNFGVVDRICKIVDFEYVSYGAWFWDLAVFIGSLLQQSSLDGVLPLHSGVSSNVTNDRIKGFCEGYGITSNGQRGLLLLWTGIYLLQSSIASNEKYFELECGLTLITDTEKCRKQIFEEQA